jgi:NAD(P)-dependent dehydrogenase (short-subunit alcohol dehydrogenase family)
MERLRRRATRGGGRGAAWRTVAAMDLELADKVAVVTGASKGIGLAVAEELAAEGALVTGGARSPEGLEGIEDVTPFAVDLGEPDGPAALVDSAIQRHGRLDILVNNVGFVQPAPGWLPQRRR